jgi:hypothetical protein
MLHRVANALYTTAPSCGYSTEIYVCMYRKIQSSIETLWTTSQMRTWGNCWKGACHHPAPLLDPHTSLKWLSSLECSLIRVHDSSITSLTHVDLPPTGTALRLVTTRLLMERRYLCCIHARRESCFFLQRSLTDIEIFISTSITYLLFSLFLWSIGQSLWQPGGPGFDYQR